MPNIDEKVIKRELQNRNPVKRLTSGPERIALKEFESAGKVRNLERDPWWYDYAMNSGEFCVFGHYSTYRGEARSSATAFCADYAVAKRWQERKAGQQGNFRGLLGAVRFPERVVIFDSGESEDIDGARA